LSTSPTDFMEIKSIAQGALRGRPNRRSRTHQSGDVKTPHPQIVSVRERPFGG
jgi:hypothetical protein